MKKTFLVCGFTVPGYVQPKERTFGNRFATPPKTRAYEKLVKDYARQAMGSKTPWRGYIGLEVEIIVEPSKSWSLKKKNWAMEGKIFPIHCDIDNQIKSLCDGMNKVVFEDDRFINSLIIRREYGIEDKAIIRVIGMQ